MKPSVLIKLLLSLTPITSTALSEKSDTIILACGPKIGMGHNEILGNINNYFNSDIGLRADFDVNINRWRLKLNMLDVICNVKKAIPNFDTIKVEDNIDHLQYQVGFGYNLLTEAKQIEIFPYLTAGLSSNTHCIKDSYSRNLISRTLSCSIGLSSSYKIKLKSEKASAIVGLIMNYETRGYFSPFKINGGNIFTGFFIGWRLTEIKKND